jgi:hypothetical protein
MYKISVGYVQNDDGLNIPASWSSSGKCSILSLTAGGETYANGKCSSINATGDIVGIVNDKDNNDLPASWSSSGILKILSLQTGAATYKYGQAFTINASGTSVGYLYETEYNMKVPVTWSSSGICKALSLTAGGEKYKYGQANDINANGAIVGYLKSDTALDPVTWSPSGVCTALSLTAGGKTYTAGQATGINANGDIVGIIPIGDGGTIPVTWSSSGILTVLSLQTGAKKYKYGQAIRINANGSSVGVLYNTSTDKTIPVTWSSSGICTALSLTAGGKKYTYGLAIGINANGDIVGGISSSISGGPVTWSSSGVCTLLSLTAGGKTYKYGIANSITDDEPTPMPNTFNVTNNGSGNYIINGKSNPTLSVTEGETYYFNINAPGHPFWIKTVLSTGTDNQYNEGVTNNGTENSTITFVVPYNSPSTLYYNCQFHSSMAGVINVINVPAPSPSPSPIPVSNICFPAGTPIRTDQGLVPIEQLNPAKHTISNQPILHVTKTTTFDKYLIAFAPHSIEKNSPTHTTLMSKDHQIIYNGKLVPAYRFLGHSKNITKVKYSGEVLYNVLLPTYSTMRVNNLLCETLHPENRIAQLYLDGKEMNTNTPLLKKNMSLARM